MIKKQAHLQDYLQVVMRRRWIVIAFFTVLVVTVLIGSLKQTPIYSATATVLIERQSPRVVSVQEVTQMGPGNYYHYKDYYETQYKLIKSQMIMKRVVNTLGLSAVDSSKKGVDPAKKLLKAISVKPIKNSQLVKISAEDPDPKMAAKIANTIADEYITQNLESNINAASYAAEWLSKKIDEQRQKLKDAELALQTYREEHNINVLPQMAGEYAIENTKAEYTKLQALLDNYSERYTDKHPKMVELKAQINSLKNKIHGLEDVDIGNITVEYRVLEREAQTNKHMYENLLARMKEIDLSSTLTVNNIRVIDMAEVPEYPIKPNLKLNMILAVLIGLVMGTGLGFFIDYLDTTIKSPQDVKEILESRFLGGIPEIKEKDEIKKDKIVHLQPRSPISEVYRGIRTELSYLGNNNSKTVLITSAEPQAGKTMTSTNLGIALSQKGSRVLIVDSDLRRPQLHKIFNLNKTLGLREYLVGSVRLDSVIKATEIENLYVVTSGKVPHNPAELIGSTRMEEFIRDIKQRFDFIIFDSPPIASVTDAVIIADMVDASIQVVRSGKAIAPVVIRAKEKLANTKAENLGVILNDLNAASGDYYYQYYRYYRYYGGERKRRDKKKEVLLKDEVKV